MHCIISNRSVQKLANESIEIVNISYPSPLALPTSTCDESFDIMNVSCPSPFALPTSTYCDESFDIVNVSWPSPLALPLFDESTDFLNVSCWSPLGPCLSNISLATSKANLPINVNTKKKKLLHNIGVSVGLKYDKKYDMVFGIHTSENQAAKFQDHVIVFMLWQPYAYYFCTNTTKTSDLVNCLETVIKIDGKEVIPVYEPLHLLKGIRNNLYNKDLIFTMDGTTYTASWEHIVAVYEHDKIMKTPNESLLLNAVCKYCKVMSAVRNTSPHMVHWKYAIQVFQSMKFINKRTGKLTVPPSVKNWIFTLKFFIYLWLQLKKCNIKYFLPRQVNQDSLEYLFGSVRSHGARNINPN
ncbi:Uncharacterized protein FWK35_00019205, partial [Aphis craccivora]